MMCFSWLGVFRVMSPCLNCMTLCRGSLPTVNQLVALNLSAFTPTVQLSAAGEQRQKLISVMYTCKLPRGGTVRYNTAVCEVRVLLLLICCYFRDKSEPLKELTAEERTALERAEASRLFELWYLFIYNCCWHNICLFIMTSYTRYKAT